MSDLQHWHGSPSEFAEPPDCCKGVIDRIADKVATRQRVAVEDATYREAKRIITGGVERLNTYEDAILTVLEGEEQQKLIRTVVEQCRRAISAATCICPRVEITTYGDAEPKYLPGVSALCGEHGRGMSR